MSIKEEARTFVVFCYFYADKSDRHCTTKLLFQSSDDNDDASLEYEANSMVKKFYRVKTNEGRMKDSKKYKRWARKFRMAHRLEPPFNHPSLEKRRNGDLSMRNSPPESCWNNQDEFELVTGETSYRKRPHPKLQ